MAKPENSETWFILHDSERFGPYTLEELKQGVEAHEINPRLDMAWKDGMTDWIPAGDIEGLFEKKTTTESTDKKESKKDKKESKDSGGAFSEVESINENEDAIGREELGEWVGVSRGGHFFFCFIFPFIWWGGLAYGQNMLHGVLPDNLIQIVVLCLFFLPVLIYIFAKIKRFNNLAMSGLWFFGLFVPFLNLWLGYRLFACPPGYAEHKRLGALGWFLAIIYWLPYVALIALVSIVMIQGTDKFKDVIEKNRPQIDSQYNEFMLKYKEVSASPEDKKAKEEAEKAAQKAKEEAEKGPSIIPIQR